LNHDEQPILSRSGSRCARRSTAATQHAAESGQSADLDVIARLRLIVAS
jgi:hypothetical protein